MARIRLYHWHAEEAKERAAKLRKAGHQVGVQHSTGPEDLKKVRARPPQAFVIDLSRMPTQGRDLAMALRDAKSTRVVPLVFVDGAADKVKMVKARLPDATFTTWTRVRGAITRSLARPPTDPIVPGHRLEGYSGTPLPKKLGIKPDFVVGAWGAPEDAAATVGALPEGSVWKDQPRGNVDLMMWFVKARKTLDSRIVAMAKKVPAGGMWILWPKKASGLATDVTQDHVRRSGLDHGLVDYKICAFDATWSGLKFGKRKK